MSAAAGGNAEAQLRTVKRSSSPETLRMKLGAGD
jgi:hypothetical protein